MTLAAATAAYDTARAAFERAREDLRLAIELDSASLLGAIPEPALAVFRAVSAEWAVSIPDLLGRRRHEALVWPRHVVLALLADHAQAPAATIAGWFGREHGAVAWSARACRERCETDRAFAARVASVRSALRA